MVVGILLLLFKLFFACNYWDALVVVRMWTSEMIKWMASPTMVALTIIEYLAQSLAWFCRTGYGCTICQVDAQVRKERLLVDSSRFLDYTMLASI